jgi:hypothetical protein
MSARLLCSTPVDDAPAIWERLERDLRSYRGAPAIAEVAAIRTSEEKPHVRFELAHCGHCGQGELIARSITLGSLKNYTEDAQKRRTVALEPAAVLAAVNP